MKMFKEVFLSKTGLTAIALIIGGLYAAEIAEKRIAGTGAEIISFAFIMVSMIGTSLITRYIASYMRYQEEEKEKKKK